MRNNTIRNGLGDTFAADASAVPSGSSSMGRLRCWSCVIADDAERRPVPRFLPSLQVAPEHFRFVSGEEAIRSIRLPVEERPPAYTHSFCGTCGSPMPFFHAATGQFALPAGSLEDDPECDAVRHIYVEHEASWYGRVEPAPRLTSAQIRDLRRSEASIR